MNTATTYAPGTILKGYTTKETAFEVNDYPYGFRLRTKIYYWIETKKGLGDRFCSYTINPKNGRPNAPKYTTYSTFMYMYINDDGHVTYGTIDSYDKEVFQARFYFILGKIGIEYLNEEQQKNIRINHYQHVKAAMPYNAVKYSADTKQDYINWCTATLQHIKTCDFENLVDYLDAPEQDQPNEEVRFIAAVRQEPKKEEQPAHEITVEKVQSIIDKALPGFYTAVSTWKGFEGTQYLKIVMAAKDHNIHGVEGQRVQVVSLSLNLRTLELQTQTYGGNGGGYITREPNREDPKEKYLAMKSVKVPFRRPAANEKDVLAAIERFAVNYKNTLIENKAVLTHRDLVNYDELLKS